MFSDGTTFINGPGHLKIHICNSILDNLHVIKFAFGMENKSDEDFLLKHPVPTIQQHATNLMDVISNWVHGRRTEAVEVVEWSEASRRFYVKFYSYYYWTKKGREDSSAERKGIHERDDWLRLVGVP